MSRVLLAYHSDTLQARPPQTLPVLLEQTSMAKVKGRQTPESCRLLQTEMNLSGSQNYLVRHHLYPFHAIKQDSFVQR